MAPRQEHATESVSDDLLKQARRFVAKWQPRLRLMDWDIWVEGGDVDANHAAESSTEWRMRRAHLTFPSNCIQRSRDGGEHAPDTTDAEIIEQTVLHELLHVAEQPLADRVDDEICWLVGTRDSGALIGAELRNGWRDYREWFINHVTRALMDAERTGGWRS